MKFAISVPIGAWHPFLPASLESLKSQGDGVSVALLDASGDERVKRLADQHDSWLAYRRHGQDAGQSAAILEGWKAIEGNWLGWLNADDILMPDALARVRAKLASNPSLDVIYGHSAILDDTGAMTGYHFNVEPPGPRLLKAGIVSQPSCFFKRATYDSIGGLNADLHYVMDWDLWIRLYESGAQFSFLEEALSMVLWGKDTKTASLNSRRRNELKTLIARHSPGQSQKGVFRDFVIHAIVDRLYPFRLREHFQRKLRRVGGSPFGVRGDGWLHAEAELHLAHYTDRQPVGVDLIFQGDTRCLEVTGPRANSSTDGKSKRVRVIFDTPVLAGEACTLTLRHAGEEDLYFQRAKWVFSA